PGSSQVLGGPAHEAHMRWALEKASALGPMVTSSMATGPAIVLVVNDHDRSQLRKAVRDLGYRLDGGEPAVVIVDADLDGGREAIAGWASANNRPSRIIAFGRSLDDLSTTALKALGADLVVPGDRLLADTHEFLPAVT
ncbi:MAG: hypothetical protein ACR2N2_06675, partial [Acidimicrobiia bacterium]